MWWLFVQLIAKSRQVNQGFLCFCNFHPGSENQICPGCFLYPRLLRDYSARMVSKRLIALSVMDIIFLACTKYMQRKLISKNFPSVLCSKTGKTPRRRLSRRQTFDESASTDFPFLVASDMGCFDFARPLPLSFSVRRRMYWLIDGIPQFGSQTTTIWS